MKKKLAILISALLVILVAGYIIYDSISVSQKYDYKRYEEIPFGYSEYDKEVDLGKDYSHFKWYKYSEMPELSDKYKKVNSDFDYVKSTLKMFNEHDISDLVTADDYYIINIESVEKLDEKFTIYFFDSEENTLYFIRAIY